MKESKKVTDAPQPTGAEFEFILARLCRAAVKASSIPYRHWLGDGQGSERHEEVFPEYAEDCRVGRPYALSGVVRSHLTQHVIPKLHKHNTRVKHGEAS